MKKNFFLMLLCAMFIGIGFTSCKGVKPGVDYNLNVNGDGDGDFTVSFPVGSLAMDGKAALALVVTNDTAALDTTHVTTKAEVLKSGDKKQLAALREVNSFVANEVEAENITGADSTSAGGTYYFHVKGYVKERLTGLVFAVDKELTNRTNGNAAPVRGVITTDSAVDEFQYVK